MRTEIFQQMREDHRRVLEDILVLERAASGRPEQRDESWPGDDARRVLRALTRQFATHMAAEDEVLYPVLIGTLPETRLSLEPLFADHDALRLMLDDLGAMLEEPAGLARNEQIAIGFQDFIDLLRIHIRKEEAIVIGVAERVLNDAEVAALAARLGRRTEADSSRPAAGHSEGDTP
jgi:hemerythrin-like domain-containing protein